MELEPDAILQAALQLPDNERFDLVARLLDTLPADSDALSTDDPNLLGELERRFGDGSPTIPWSDVQAQE